MNTEASNNKEVVVNYFEMIWNQRQMSVIDQFISDDYVDYSFLPAVPPDKTGLIFWVRNITEAFDHITIIESIVAEDDQVAVRISFNAKHVGKWRNMPPTHREVTVKGFRFFKLRDKKIIAHWALLDGESLQSLLTETQQGCVLPDDH